MTAADVLADVMARLNTIPAIAQKIVVVYGEDDLSKKVAGITTPGLGIQYEGMRSVGDSGSTSKAGVSAEMVFSLIVIQTPETFVRTDIKGQTINLLDSIRDSLIAQKSPTGHIYRFVVEAPAELKQGMTFWVQRWSVPIQVAPLYKR